MSDEGNAPKGSPPEASPDENDHVSEPGDAKLQAPSNEFPDLLFLCPRCNHVIEVSPFVKFFRCPVDQDIFKISIGEYEPPVVEDKSGKDDAIRLEAKVNSFVKKRREIRRRDVRKQHLSMSISTSDDIAKMARQIVNTKEENKKYNYDIVKCPSVLPTEVFDAIKNMFLLLDPLCTGKVQVETVSKHLRDYILKVDRKICNMADSILDKNMDRFGPQYNIRFITFINELEEYIKSANATFRRLNTTSFVNKLARLDTMEIFYQSPELDKFKSKGWFGLWLLDLAIWWKTRSFQSVSLIPLWKKALNNIEAKYGANIASVFYFFRWLYLVNLFLVFVSLFVLVPYWQNYDWSLVNARGFFVGKGMEDSWLFYGGYPTSIDGYRIDVSWVLVCFVILFASLIMCVSYIGTGHFEKENNNFAFSQALFAAWDHHITYKQQASLSRKHIHTKLDYLLKSFDDDMKATRKESLNRRIQKMFPRLVAYSAEVFVMVMTCVAVNLLINLESEQLVNDFSSSAKYLIVPFSIASLRVVSPFVIELLIKMEWIETSRQKFYHFYSRLFVLRMAMVLTSVFSTSQASDNHRELTSTCSETQIGMMMYRILFADFCAELFTTLMLPGFLVGSRNLYYHCRGELMVKRSGLAAGNKISVRSDTLEMVDVDGSGRNLETEEKTEVQELDYYIDPQNDPLKQEFNIPVNICDTMYRQALVWAGMPFSPVMPLLSFILSFLLFYMKRGQVTWFSKRPENPMGVSRQIRFFRTSLIFTMVVSIAPFTFFLRRVVSCGPHQLPITIDGVTYEPDQVLVIDASGVATNTSLSVIDVFVKHIETMPAGVTVTVAYLSNVFILWLIVSVILVYAFVLRKRQSFLNAEIESISTRLKIETKEKQAIIRGYDIVLGEDEMRGRDAFKLWMDTLGGLGRLYSQKLIDVGYGDLLRLARLNDDQVEGIFTTIGAPPGHVKLLQRKLEEQRLELLSEKLGDQSMLDLAAFANIDEKDEEHSVTSRSAVSIRQQQNAV